MTINVLDTQSDMRRISRPQSKTDPTCSCTCWSPSQGCIATSPARSTSWRCTTRAADSGSAVTTNVAFGVPDRAWRPPEGDVVMVGLKIRTAPVHDAVEQVRMAHRRLSAVGITEFYSKSCSTFDSTDAGNIGPISDALLDATGRAVAIACPTSPEHGRTVHQGHLFVHGRLLSESSMRVHPLTPMTDSRLVEVLGRQTTRPVRLVDHVTVRRGAHAVATALDELIADGCRHAVVDAANHGPIVSGPDMASAVDAIEEFEETAKLFLLLAPRRSRPLTDRQVRETHGVGRGDPAAMDP